MLDFNKVHNIDYKLGFQQLESGSVDLIFTDPPYMLTKAGVHNDFMKKGIFDKSVYDNKGKLFQTVEFKDWIPEAYRVLKPNADFYVMSNDKNLQTALNVATQSGFRLHNILVWYKGNHVPTKWYMKSCEFILYFFKGKAKPINDMSSFQINMTRCIIGNRKHPTEKPVELVKYYIANSSQKGDLVLDPFAGSGSTGIACLSLDRRFLGFEIEAKYCDKANDWLKAHQLQMIK
jgi:site-specific DNA-methyltransferase (adenine-specific)